MIDGVKVVELVTHEDDRGYLTEVARHADNPEPHAVVHRFGQVYLVGNPARGTIRAFHKHEELWDWFFISHGSAKFVLKDDRAESRTYGSLMTVIASARKPRLIVVPPGVYHGGCPSRTTRRWSAPPATSTTTRSPTRCGSPRTPSATSGP